MLPLKRVFRLNTGAEIPAVGLGTWQASHDVAVQSVKSAIAEGYSHIDTAFTYGYVPELCSNLCLVELISDLKRNEEAIGQAISEIGVAREKLFITDKVWNTYHSRPEVALEMCLSKLRVDYLDLWLLHW